jgi:hypothetical protein
METIDWGLVLLLFRELDMKENHKHRAILVLLHIIFIALWSNINAYSQERKLILFPNDTITILDKLRFLDSINKYRVKKGIAPVIYSFHDDKLGRIRVKSIFKHIDSITVEQYTSNPVTHLHWNFERDVRRYEKKYVPMDSVITRGGECSAYLGILSVLIKRDRVKDLFEGWKGSPPHWAQMMNPDFTHIVLSWKIDRKSFESQKLIASLVLFNKVLAKKSNQEEK